MFNGASQATVTTTLGGGKPAAPSAGGSSAKVSARPMLPELEFKDDEQLLEWLETCRKIFEKIAEELDEHSGHVHAKWRRYLKRKGRSGVKAGWYARSVSLPISRAADAAEDLAGYLKMAGTRTEALVEALGGDVKAKNYDDFGVKGVDK